MHLKFRLSQLALAAVLLTGLIRAAEHATYNSGGALTALIHDGREIPINAGWWVELQGGVRAPLQPHDQKSPIVRDGANLRWHGHTTFPNGSAAQFTAEWLESDDGVAVNTAAIAGAPAGADESQRHSPAVDLASLDYVIDVPRDVFVGGQLQSGAGNATLTRELPAEPTFMRGTSDRIAFSDAKHNWKLTVSFKTPVEITVTDFWSSANPLVPLTPGFAADMTRVYRVRVSLRHGTWAAGDSVPLEASFRLEGHADAAPAHMVVWPDQPVYEFDGFGADYCFGNNSPAAKYIFDHLTVAWARCEFKAADWDRERKSPGPNLVTDFELMQKLTQQHVPWVLSMWRLPERYYSDANQKPPGTFGRRIAAERWPEFLDLLGSFMLYAKEKYGAEPDFFSFNEPDLGVDLGFTPETHRDTIKKLGAEFERLGLKTKLLLGDTANPRDSHKYVLATAADPAAMRYVGALSVHSWWGGTPEQYRAWAEVAAWVKRPLIVAEAGVDPGAYRNMAYDSYAYGLREAAQYLDLLRHARPVSLLYWEYTNDYSLVRVAKDGTVTPTGRFWLMKQYTDFTPRHSHVIATASDHTDVLVGGFVHDGALALHILNVGPARSVSIHGLPRGDFDVVRTTEDVGLQRAPLGNGAAGEARTLDLPARSLTTLVQASAPTAK